MKRNILFLTALIIFCRPAFADNYLPVSSQINNRMFSPEGTRPLMNLERTQYTNSAIMNIETKYNVQNSQAVSNTPEELPKKEEPKGIKSWFKGFVVEW